MAYKALYNKYRPSTFDEVVGQRAIVRTMKNAIENNKIAHAYLFCGPRGTGKTSMARLFAKALNCEEGIGHQCNHCSNCEALNNSSHPDVIEIDAASNNGVEQARDLIDKVRYAPIKGKYKIYIIDEVHMMTSGAFNALLKTLEEPPEHVIFILATTEPYKVIPTIVSRCQRYDFAKIDDKEIREKLVWILEKEGVKFEPSALDTIVSLADGGMRDALSILDQAIAYGGNALKEKDVLDVFGLASSAQKCNLLKLLAEGSLTDALALAESFISSGIDIKRLTLSLLNILKDCIVYIKTKSPALLQEAKEEDIKKLLPLLNPAKINAMIDTLLKFQSDSKTVASVRSLFELTLIRLASEEPAPVVYEQPKVVEKPVAPKVAEAPSPKQPEQESGIYQGETPPDWLFEDEQKAPEPEKEPEPLILEPKKEEKKPEPPKPQEPLKPIFFEEEKKAEPEARSATLLRDGTPLVLDDNTIINIMAVGPKYREQRKALLARWDEILNAGSDPKLTALATLLHEGQPFCLCDRALLVTYNFTRKKEMLNVKENQNDLMSIFEPIFGRRIFVYALDRNDSSRLTKIYYDLKQVNKLPNPDDVQLTLPFIGGIKK